MTMNEPFVFIGTHRLQHGKREAYETYVKDFVDHIEEREPQLRLFRFYFDEDSEHVTVVQVHPDAESMGVHMKVASEHIQDAYSDYLEETVSIQIFGEPTAPVLSTMRQLAGEGVPVSIHRPLYGFDRFDPMGAVS
jgi:quinol monooxygenase YgiN